MDFPERPPGSPDGIRALASIWRGASTSAAEAADTLDSAKQDVTGGALKLQGDFATKITGPIGEVPGELRKLSTGYQKCAAALEKYAGTLQAKQRSWDFETVERDAALRNQQFAEWDLNSLAPNWTPDRDPSLDFERLREAALNGQPDLGPQIADAWRRRTEAQALADTKNRLAADQVALREEAEDTCAREIDAALDDAGIKDKEWWQKAGQWLADLVPSWGDFVKFCETLSMVLGVVAMFAGPLAPALLALAAAATAVVVLDRLFKLANGEISWKQMAGDLAMIALNKVGGKALGAGFKAYRKTDLSKQISGYAHRGADKVLGSRFSDQARNRMHRQVCRVTGHPVDVANGKVYTSFTDLELPGPLPLTLDRVWFSTSTYTGPLGHGWHHAFDAAVLVTADETVYRSPDGRYVDLLYLLAGESVYDRQERLTIARDETGYRITGADGITRRFAAGTGPLKEPADPADPIVFALREAVSSAGHRITCTHDDRDRLVEIVDSGGREIGFTYDDHDRATTLTAPHPDEAGARFTVATYDYDEAGNLVSMTDARGYVFRYGYEGHLLVEETDRTGLTFHFRYDGSDETARCISTWGDDDLYRRTLVYESGSTLVVNSLGHASRHFHDGGLVVRTIDALGGETRTEYDYAQPVEETDALGRVTTYVYDWRGNQHQVTTPDGATVTVDFDQTDRPVRAVDQVDGEWTWYYDEAGLLNTRRDPLGRTTRMAYARGLLERITGPAGGQTLLRYDTQGSLVELTTPDGAVTAWDRNALGWPIGATDPLSNTTSRIYDLAGNIARVEEPDGNVREMGYDGEANLTSATDVLYDVQLTYQGMGRLASRTQSGTTVRFEYDTEEQFTALTNEHGHVYSFTYNPNGLVQTERTFGDVLRVYERDIAGRLVSVRRASGLTTRHEYDDADRVVRIEHSDGSSQRCEYRADGALLMAGNDTIDVHFERDVLGRLVREGQGEHWVASEYDELDRRIRMFSSMWADQHYTRNSMGDVMAVEGNGYAAQFTRNAVGQELTRAFPGGAEARWHRDRLGRPIRQQITTPGGTTHRERAYEWQVGGRLQGILDNVTGPVRYRHDGLGQLVSATHGDGQVELRMPDAVGNLFRTQDRSDREYGPAGEVLRALGDNGRRITYDYDPEGNLIAKTADDGERWEYRWYADGNMASVLRPDGAEVTFTYDALSRRVTKMYRGHTTHWVWDGDVILHEWVTGEPLPPPLIHARSGTGATLERERIMSEAFHRGRLDPDVADSPITWLFDPETFAPAARVRDNLAASLVTDLLGAPVAELGAIGVALRDVRVTVYGHVQPMSGMVEPPLTPMRFPGQYEDYETELFYNRYRYYDPDSGQYTSADPLRLGGGMRLTGYVSDPGLLTDFLGLSENPKRYTRKSTSRSDPESKVPVVRGYTPAGRAADYDLDELAQFAHSHAGVDDVTRPTLGEIRRTLDEGTPVPLEGQNSVRVDLSRVRVIVNEDNPPRSTAYYPGR